MAQPKKTPPAPQTDWNLVDDINAMETRRVKSTKFNIAGVYTIGLLRLAAFCCRK